MTTPDPKTVREIAREAVRMLATDSVRGRLVEAAMAKYGIPTGDVNAWHAVYNTAIGAILDAQITVEWPAEQQPADVVTAEQQQDGAAEDVTAFLDAWEADRGFGNAIRGGNGDIPYLFATDLRAVLAERTALAAPAAELTAGQDMCTCNEPRKVCELRTELDRVHAQLNAALAERPEES